MGLGKSKKRKMNCGIALCERRAAHVLEYKATNKKHMLVYLCESCLRAYELGRRHCEKQTKTEVKMILLFDDK